MTTLYKKTTKIGLFIKLKFFDLFNKKDYFYRLI